ncbi:hypothetical protein SAMN05444380_11422 [Thermophagus xiamenensis]|uniref:Uncharacterized protein n=1 Tax=Thermophagus xiamenensis TaxID=385682 RepID=A0A1I2BS05_9BACT|nr:hypothetical protein SAMN05444380_11422 [Thermophagus xiamenensis]
MTGVRKDIFKNIQENRTQVSMKVGITPMFKILKPISLIRTLAQNVMHFKKKMK